MVILVTLVFLGVIHDIAKDFLVLIGFLLQFWLKTVKL